MTREDRLRLCKTCIHKKADFNRGMLCGRTNEYAEFEVSCRYYEMQPNLLQEKLPEVKTKVFTEARIKILTGCFMILVPFAIFFYVFGFNQFTVEALIYLLLASIMTPLGVLSIIPFFIGVYLIAMGLRDNRKRKPKMWDDIVG